MNGQTFCQNPCKRGRSHHHQGSDHDWKEELMLDALHGHASLLAYLCVCTSYTGPSGLPTPSAFPFLGMYTPFFFLFRFWALGPTCKCVCFYVELVLRFKDYVQSWLVLSYACTHLFRWVCLKWRVYTCHWGHPFLRMYFWWSSYTLCFLACQVELL